MNTYSQNKEDLIALEYFGDFKGSLLEVGANDGQTLSNSKLLIQNGWKATLLEPGSTFDLLDEFHKNKKNVQCFNFGISSKTEVIKFYESGAHIKNGHDRGLVSTTDVKEMQRWQKRGVEFKNVTAQMHSFDWFECRKFDFISIDAEGMDWVILQQIDLRAVGCQLLCIEWNSDMLSERLFRAYCHSHGLYELIRNPENIIYGL